MSGTDLATNEYLVRIVENTDQFDDKLNEVSFLIYTVDLKANTSV